MIKSTKIAISLPTKHLNRIEKIRKESGLERSVVIDEAIRFWLDNRDKLEMVKQYEAGYRSKPESADELKAMESLAADAFDEEGLQ